MNVFIIQLISKPGERACTHLSAKFQIQGFHDKGEVVLDGTVTREEVFALCLQFQGVGHVVEGAKDVLGKAAAICETSNVASSIENQIKRKTFL